MVDSSEPAVLTYHVTTLLRSAGYSVMRSADMRYWSLVMESHGAWVNPHLHGGMFPSDGEFIALFDQAGAFAATIAWREIQTINYADLMRSGHAWSPTPEAFGWERLEPGAGDEIGGIIHSRGGLWRRPDLGAHRLSWYVTSLSWAIAAERTVDFVVSQAKPDVRDKSLTRRLYGYRNTHVMPEHFYPWVGARIAAELVWSDAEAIRDEVARRVRFLRQCHGQDLRATVDAYQRYQQAIEQTQPIWAAAGNEREAVGA